MSHVKEIVRQAPLPINEVAKLALKIESLRGACSNAAAVLSKRGHFGDLEECARLDDALAKARQVLAMGLADVVSSLLSRMEVEG